VADRRKVVAGAVVVVAALGVGAYLVWGPDDGADKADQGVELPPGTIAAVDTRYLVDAVTVASGDPLTFENRGPSHHTLTADDGRFDSGVLEAGETFTVALDGPREIAVHCEIHPTMRAVITVTAP
jgi:plastocyanin